MWKCSKCGERVDDSFEVCWSCGTSVDGVEDPHFMVQTSAQQVPGPEWQDDEAPEKLVTVTSCSMPAQALAIRLRLEAAGIPVFLADEYTIAMDWLLSNAIGGIKVQVPEPDVEHALEILAEVEERPGDEEDGDEHESDDSSDERET